MIPENAKAAIAYMRAGFNPMPVASGSKVPVLNAWQERRRASPDEIHGWFDGHPTLNVGLICGPQPSGLNLYAIDIDPKNGGDASWDRLVAGWGGVPETAWHLTPSGGRHLFFNAPADLVVVNRRLAKGVDTRGPQGQVVVPPSVVGGRSYSADAQTAVHKAPIALMPDGIIELLTTPPLVVVVPDDSVRRHPSSQGFMTPADWVREHLDFMSYLAKHGWVHAGKESWRRPGKTDRGTSAELKNGGTGPLNVFTTEVPPSLEHLGTLDRTGQCVSVSLFDFIAAYEFGGDRSAAASWVRREYMTPPAPVGRAGPDRDLESEARAASPVPGSDGTPPPLFLEAAWYEQRPWMQACLRMAQAVGGSPSAHLLAYLARWATLIPPGYSIPPINGAPSSFDLLGVIAGSSGSGKTSPMRNAAELLPIGRKDIRHGLGIGSGEGIIEAFYEWVQVVGEDGKKLGKERRKTISGVNFSVSEGLIFAELAGRGGTTHVTRLCDAWSGAPLSTANASAETFRHIDVNQYRLTLVMGIQADMAHELMNDSSASQGFVGRLLFAWAEEPRVSPRPMPPERPSVPVPQSIVAAGVFQQTYLTYPEQVYAEIQGAADARVGTKVPVEEHHHDLLRCKIAGIVALMDGRLDVSLDDWAIATDLVSTSANIRRYLYEHRRRAERDRRHVQAVARAETEIVVEDVKERQAIARLAETIRRKVADQPWSRNKLCKATTSTGTRHRFDAAMNLAVANGWISDIDGRIEPA